MAELNISTLDDQRNLEQYTAARNAARDAVKNGVYPNCVACMDRYDELAALLAGDLSQFAEYHTETMELVLPHIATIRDAMETIVATVEAIDVAAYTATGADMFGTYTPEEVEE